MYWLDGWVMVIRLLDLLYVFYCLHGTFAEFLCEFNVIYLLYFVGTLVPSVRSDSVSN